MRVGCKWLCLSLLAGCSPRDAAPPIAAHVEISREPIPDPRTAVLVTPESTYVVFPRFSFGCGGRGRHEFASGCHPAASAGPALFRVPAGEQQLSGHVEGGAGETAWRAIFEKTFAFEPARAYELTVREGENVVDYDIVPLSRADFLRRFPHEAHWLVTLGPPLPPSKMEAGLQPDDSIVLPGDGIETPPLQISAPLVWGWEGGKVRAFSRQQLLEKCGQCSEEELQHCGYSLLGAKESTERTEGVSDVTCQQALGTGWRLPREREFELLTKEEKEILSQALSSSQLQARAGTGVVVFDDDHPAKSSIFPHRSRPTSHSIRCVREAYEAPKPRPAPLGDPEAACAVELQKRGSDGRWMKGSKPLAQSPTDPPLPSWLVPMKSYADLLNQDPHQFDPSRVERLLESRAYKKLRVLFRDSENAGGDLGPDGAPVGSLEEVAARALSDIGWYVADNARQVANTIYWEASPKGGVPRPLTGEEHSILMGYQRLLQKLCTLEQEQSVFPSQPTCRYLEELWKPPDSKSLTPSQQLERFMVTMRRK